MTQNHDVMIMSGYKKVKKKAQCEVNEVNGADMVMMYEKQADMEEWTGEDEMMRGYSDHAD